MKKFLKRALIFIVFATLVYPIFLYFWGDVLPQIFRNASNLVYVEKSGDFMKLRMQEAKTKADVDVLVLGSSHAYRGFDPRIFGEYGIDLFNMGSSSQTPMQTEVLLERYFEKLNPEIVIFEVYPGVFSSDGVESSLDILSRDVIDSHAIEMAFRINHLKTYNTLIFASIKNFINSSIDDSVATTYKGQRYISGGYVERIEYSNYEGEVFQESNWDLKPEQFMAFERCLDIMEKSDAKIFLVYAPITKDLYDARGNNQEFIDRLLGYGKPVINFNEILELDDSEYFYDSDHLNQNGVDHFNRQLISVIDFTQVVNK